MIDIEVDSPFDVDKKIAEWRIQRLNAEIIRLRLKCGEDITSDELLMGFAQPDGGGFNIKRSPRWPA